MRQNRVRMTDEQGQVLEFVVWNAGDLRDFPLQAQLNDGGANVLIRYRNVQLTKPDARQFDPPKDYTRHKDFGQLFQAAVLKQGARTPKKK